MWFVPFSFRDLIDIVLVAMLFYWLYRSTRGTNVMHIITGVGVIYIIWVVVRALNMDLLSNILGQIISIGGIALVVLFQPEIRRFLQHIGLRSRKLHFLLSFFGVRAEEDRSVLAIVEAVESLSRSRHDAIIVVQRMSDLSLIIDGGVLLDANLSAQLLRSIFLPESPLRDGAVVISAGRVVAARAILPVTQIETLESISDSHRAALGLTEISDAVVVVVAATQISIAHSGYIKRNITTDELVRELRKRV
ncbi:MAG: diadenylate cyclase [Rikenellaceae bacterium]